MVKDTDTTSLRHNAKRRLGLRKALRKQLIHISQQISWADWNRMQAFLYYVILTSKIGSSKKLILSSSVGR